MAVSRFLLALLSLFFVFFFVRCNELESSEETTVQPTEEISDSFVLPPTPDTVLFCGKQIVMKNFDMKERLDKELIVNTFYHSSTIQALKRANRYFPILEELLKDQGIPEDFKYLCLIESGLTQAVSPAGAKGFWQFMPATAKEFDLRIDKEMDERLHIEKSTLAACSYLKKAFQRFNDWTLVAASYNMGVGGVGKALKDQEVEEYFDLHLNNETSRYVFRILALKVIFEDLENYGFDRENLELYEPIEVRKIELTETTDSLKHWAKEQGSNYHMLKVLNPWIKGDKLTVGETSIIVDLPK